MKEYACPKCCSLDTFIDDRGDRQALICGDCGAWIKWIGKKEMPLVKMYMESKDKPTVKKEMKINDLDKFVEFLMCECSYVIQSKNKEFISYFISRYKD